MTHTIEDVVAAYVGIRDQKRQMEKAHDEALKPINEKLEKIEAWLLSKMNDDGVDSYKTGQGTAYKSSKLSCSMADSSIYKTFVFAPVAQILADTMGLNKDAVLTVIQQAALWQLVDFRALKKGVEEYMEDHKQVPPGLDVSKTTTVNIRSK